MPIETKTARLEARLPQDVHSLLKQAAALEGSSLSHFVVTTAQQAAKDLIARHETIELTKAEQKRFAEAILNPPPVAPALRRAMKHRERLLEPS